MDTNGLMVSIFGTDGKKVVFDAGKAADGLFSAEITLKSKKDVDEFRNILIESNKNQDGIVEYKNITFKMDYIDISIILEEL